jgi:hypothetical protein
MLDVIEQSQRPSANPVALKPCRPRLLRLLRRGGKLVCEGKEEKRRRGGEELKTCLVKRRGSAEAVPGM